MRCIYLVARAALTPMCGGCRACNYRQMKFEKATDKNKQCIAYAHSAMRHKNCAACSTTPACSTLRLQRAPMAAAQARPLHGNVQNTERTAVVSCG
ncbi:hypothetical protein JKP88DRAFT_219246 [Tribonema minus]|uniref:Uncharacterized protein n=1 Tax=Tribonema minus TaxID=303371 RepID=A0A836CG47_9STRA|nr:hypothetical protein JKP88DRAFT_219246 [Tribonema minus]